MAPILDGPRCAAASGGTSSLVVFLHGYGADGSDLFSLSRPLAALLPNTAFASPNAPYPCELGGPGFQWFGLRAADGSMNVRVAGADQAAPILQEFLQEELDRYGIDSSRLALIGFSQGTMMALHVGLGMTPLPAAIIGFSGILVAPDRLDNSPGGKPPVLLVHGTADPVVPFASLEAAATALRGAGIEAETFARPGLGHGIDDEGLRVAAQFLARHLGSLSSDS